MKRVNILYKMGVSSDGKAWLQYREESGKEHMDDGRIDNIIQVVNNIVGDELHKIDKIYTRDILNGLERVDLKFKQKQEEWRKHNKHLRNTLLYSIDCYNELHLFDAVGLLEYYKQGFVVISEKLLSMNAEKIKERMLKNMNRATVNDWI